MQLVNVNVGEGRLEPLARRKRNIRTRQIFTCAICRSKTNLARATGVSIGIYCPNIQEKWHDTLQRKLDRLRGETGHPASYIKELKKEITAIKAEHPPKIATRGNTNGSRNMYDGHETLFSYPSDW